MGRFCELKGGKGYLTRWQSLAPDRKIEAENEADRQVDDMLWEWEKSGWQGENVPPDVAAAAGKIAAGEYLRLSMSASLASGEGSLGESLLKEGKKELQLIVERGGPMAPRGGGRIPKKSQGSSSSSLFMGIRK